MSCKLYFIRHGESLGNKTSTFLGHTNIDLSDLGYSQAKCAAKYLMNLHIDKVYSSDLLRAYNTCNEFLKLSHLTAEKRKELREIFAGDWEGKSYADLSTIYKDSYTVWLTDIGNAHPLNGETLPELQNRMVNCITEIAENNDGKNVAIFTHACALRSFITFAKGFTLNEMKDIPWSTNASLTKVEYTDGKFKVLEYSNDSYLGELKSQRPKNV